MASKAITGTLKWSPKVGTLTVGMFGELRRAFSQAEVIQFANLTGDDNPVHQDASFAANTRFKRPIVHGMLFGSLIGSVFGASVPGSIYMSQRFDFKRPVYMDEPLVARVEVVEVTHVPRHTARCSTTITSQVTGQLVLSGEAMVMLPPMPT